MKNQKKKIGIIGGVGPQATQVIYEKIIQLSQKKYNAEHNDDYPSIIIESVPVPDFISSTKDMDQAKKMLIKAARDLSKAGATVLSIGSNTVHLLLNELENTTEIPFISMPNLVAKKCKQNSYSKVGLLGSPVTLDSNLYNRALDKQNIKTIKPDLSQRKVVDKIIRYVLAGKDNSANREEYINILNDLFNQGSDAVILGCTELPLAINYEALGNKIINSMDVLAESLVDYYYS